MNCNSFRVCLKRFWQRIVDTYFTIATYFSAQNKAYKKFKSDFEKQTTEYELGNGLKVVLVQNKQSETVLVSTVYGVGSSHEDQQSRAMAHFLEHMAFKGTPSLSESDVWQMKARYNAQANALTSKDCTLYYFETHKDHWKLLLNVLADCGQNLTLGQEQIASELKAVIQELKAYKDNHAKVAIDLLTKMLLQEGHRYGHTIIGSLEDLTKINSENLMEFYKKHYQANNCTVFVVGDFEVEQAKEAIEKGFGPWPKLPSSKENLDLFDQSQALESPSETTIYSEVGSANVFLGWKIPGFKDAKTLQTASLYNGLLSTINGSSIVKGSSINLHTTLVEKLKLANKVNTSVTPLEEMTLFSINFSCKEENISKCKEVVFQEMAKHAESCVKTLLLSGLKFSSKLFYPIMYRTNKTIFLQLAHMVLLNDKNKKIWRLADQLPNILPQDVSEFVKHYLDPSKAQTVVVLPINEQVKQQILTEQAENERLEAQLLAKYNRTTPLEASKLAEPDCAVELYKSDVKLDQQSSFFTLENGIKITAVNRKDLQEQKESFGNICCVIRSANQDFFTKSLHGCVDVASALSLLIENCQKAEIVKVFGELGAFVSCNIESGITLIVQKQNFNQALKALGAMINKRKITAEDVTKYALANVARMEEFSKMPNYLLNRITTNTLFPNSEFCWNFDDAKERFKALDLTQIENALGEFFAPSKLSITICGDLPDGWEKAVSKNFNQISDNRKETKQYCWPKPVESVCLKEQTYQLVTAQKTIAIIRPRLRNALDLRKAALLDILSKTVLADAGSELFALLREEYGLFYTATGSFGATLFFGPYAGADRICYGHDIISTSCDANKKDLLIDLIFKLFDRIGKYGVNKNRFIGARQALYNTFTQIFKQNTSLANGLAFVAANDLGQDYYQNLLKEIETVTIEEINQLAKECCTKDLWTVIDIGNQNQ